MHAHPHCMTTPTGSGSTRTSYSVLPCAGPSLWACSCARRCLKRWGISFPKRCLCTNFSLSSLPVQLLSWFGSGLGLWKMTATYLLSLINGTYSFSLTGPALEFVTIVVLWCRMPTRWMRPSQTNRGSAVGLCRWARLPGSRCPRHFWLRDSATDSTHSHYPEPKLLPHWKWSCRLPQRGHARAGRYLLVGGPPHEQVRKLQDRGAKPELHSLCSIFPFHPNPALLSSAVWTVIHPGSLPPPALSNRSLHSLTTFLLPSLLLLLSPAPYSRSLLLQSPFALFFFLVLLILTFEFLVTLYPY